MTIRIPGCVATLMVAATSLPAQQPTVRGDTFDLARAVFVARQANPRLAAADAEAAAARARLGPAGAWPDPMLELGVMNRMLPGFSTADPMAENRIALTQAIPISGSAGLRRRVARADSARAVAGRGGVLLELEWEVRARYWELYHADRALDLMERTVAVLRDLAAITGTMYAVGQSAQADVIRSQLAVTRMQQELVDMRLMRVTAAAELNTLLARPAEALLVLPAAHEGAVPMSMAAPRPLDSLAALADSVNPDIRAAASAVQASAANEALARRMLIPDLEVGVAYGQRPRYDDMVSLMVGVSIPLFAGSRQLRWRDEAGAMRVASDQMLRERRLEVRRRLATVVAEAETARQQVTAYTATLLPQAQAGYESALAAYRVGRVDFATVLDARMALLQYQHDLHRYEAAYGTAVAGIDRLIGRAYGGAPWDR